MPRRTIDLSSHFDHNVERGGPADFPVTLKPVYYRRGLRFSSVPNRRAVVREDTGEPLSIVSDRYTLVPHQRILGVVEQAIGSLKVTSVPRGIYVDRGGARMRALFKFPSLAQPVRDRDEICPCLRVQNTYDGTSRVALHIGAFRFVCTNYAVGGGGVFAGGFMAVHQGEIPIEEVADQLTSYLEGFEAIVELYRFWGEQQLGSESLERVMESLPKKPAEAIQRAITTQRARTVYEAYNAATYHATHRMRSYRGAFDLLERINGSFQGLFPLPSEN